MHDVAIVLEAEASMPTTDDKRSGSTPGEDEPKLPRRPGNNNPEPDVPDENDELGDLLRPVTA
jgi:hypothetical protein